MKRSKPAADRADRVLVVEVSRPPRILEPHEVGAWVTWGRIPVLPELPK